MKKLGRILLTLICVSALIVGATLTASAHSGRTDGNGGHKDNQNKSGLGSYHYHCGGYPAHLHTKGYCPYTDVFPKVEALSEGTATIYATASNGVAGSFTLQVYEKYVEIVEFSDEDLSLNPGDTQSLAVTVFPVDATNTQLT